MDCGLEGDLPALDILGDLVEQGLVLVVLALVSSGVERNEDMADLHVLRLDESGLVATIDVIDLRVSHRWSLAQLASLLHHQVLLYHHLVLDVLPEVGKRTITLDGGLVELVCGQPVGGVLVLHGLDLIVDIHLRHVDSVTAGALAEKLVIDHHIQHLDWLHAGRVLPGLGVQVLVLLDTVIQILGGDHRGLGQIYGGGRIADGGEHIAGCNQDARDDGCDTFHEASSPLIRDSP